MLDGQAGANVVVPPRAPLPPGQQTVRPLSCTRPAISAGEATARMRRDRDIRRAGVYKPPIDIGTGWLSLTSVR
jgi:hypothetical protein